VERGPDALVEKSMNRRAFASKVGELRRFGGRIRIPPGDDARKSTNITLTRIIVEGRLSPGVNG